MGHTEEILMGLIRELRQNLSDACEYWTIYTNAQGDDWLTKENKPERDAITKAKLSLTFVDQWLKQIDGNADTAVATDLTDVVDKLAERECEYGSGADCNNLPQGVRRSPCLVCQARAALKASLT